MMTIESTLSGGFDMHTGLNVLEAYPLNGKNNSASWSRHVARVAGERCQSFRTLGRLAQHSRKSGLPRAQRRT